VRESEDEGEGDGWKQGIWSSDLVTRGEQLRNREPRPARREGGGVFRVCERGGGARGGERAGKEKDKGGAYAYEAYEAK
jgi:hypothetical protein